MTSIKNIHLAGHLYTWQLWMEVTGTCTYYLFPYILVSVLVDLCIILWNPQIVESSLKFIWKIPFSMHPHPFNYWQRRNLCIECWFMKKGMQTKTSKFVGKSLGFNDDSTGQWILLYCWFNRILNCFNQGSTITSWSWSRPQCLGRV